MSRAWILGLGAVVIAIVVLGVVALLLATSGDDTLVLDLEPGDCLLLPEDMTNPAIGNVRVVGCDEPHEAEVFATGELDPDRDQPYPADPDQLFAQVDRACADTLAERPDVVDRFGVLPVVADERSWESFRGLYVCVAIPYGGGTTTGSLGF